MKKLKSKGECCKVVVISPDKEGFYMNVQMAYNLFLVDRESYCSDKSILYYRENILKFMNFLSDRIGSAPDLIECDAISRELVLAYLSQLRGTGCKNTSINTYFRAAKVFLNYCIDEGYCLPDVLRKIKFLKKDNDPVIPLTQVEVDSIDGLFNDRTESGLRNLCIVHLMLDAGFRCGDVVSLKFSNISFSGNYLTVKGKGSKFRTVLLCPKLKKLLSHYLIKFRAYDPKDDYPVFVKVGSNEPINSNVIKQLFARIKKTSEIDRVHPHLLRHTFATSYIVGGGSMEFLRLMMGHEDYETTKIYLHLAQEVKMLHSDIYKLDSSFFEVGY